MTMSMLVVLALVLSISFCCQAFVMQGLPKAMRAKSSLRMADVEVVFPNGKKVKVPAGSSFRDAASKAGYEPNYGCDEGKCSACELKMNGKQKVRPCIAKVPNSSTPIKLEEL